MSFKLIIFFIVVAGCGVKGPPIAKQQKIPSLLEQEYPELNPPPTSSPGE